MPELIEDAKLVETWIRSKQELEVMLAWDILETFNTAAELIAPLRAAAGKAIAEMVAACEADKKYEAVVKKAIDADKGKMALLDRIVAGDTKAGKPGAVIKDIKTIADLKKYIDDEDGATTFDAQECADVVRLYGTFVALAPKEVGGLLEETYKALEKKKGDVKKGGAEVWNTGNMKELSGRHRGLVGNQYEEAMAKPNFFTVKDFLLTMKGGQSLWELKDTSTINKIDAVFGLVPASDISATTLDTIFFIQRFFGLMYPAKFDHLFFLLALATIVSGAHHSTIEVATPLSQSKILDYHIGKFTTLLPVKRGPKHKGFTEIDKALQTAEKHKDNHFMLVFYDAKKKVAGCYEYTGKEKAWLDFTDCVNVMKVFQKVPLFPTKDVVFKLIQENGIA